MKKRAGATTITASVMVEQEVDVEVDLDDLNEEDVIEYLEGKGYTVVDQRNMSTNTKSVVLEYTTLFQHGAINEVLIKLEGTGVKIERF